VTDDDLVMYVLNGLGPEFNSFVVSITTSSRHQPYTYLELHASLMSYENLLQGRNLSNGLLPTPNNPTTLIAQNRPGQNRSTTIFKPNPITTDISGLTKTITKTDPTTMLKTNPLNPHTLASTLIHVMDHLLLSPTAPDHHLLTQTNHSAKYVLNLVMSLKLAIGGMRPIHPTRVSPPPSKHMLPTPSPRPNHQPNGY
jgi:hypothetical protein